MKRVTHITADIHETIHQTVEQNQVSLLRIYTIRCVLRQKKKEIPQF